jgi:hypothetical protein
MTGTMTVEPVILACERCNQEIYRDTAYKPGAVRKAKDEHKQHCPAQPRTEVPA